MVHWLRIYLPGNTGSIPGWKTKISHATEQLNPHVATREALRQLLLSPHTLEPPPQEKHATRKSPCAMMKTVQSKSFFNLKKKEIIASITVCKVVKGDDKESGS